jgi:hypothetical protein
MCVLCNHEWYCWGSEIERQLLQRERQSALEPLEHHGPAPKSRNSIRVFPHTFLCELSNDTDDRGGSKQHNRPERANQDAPATQRTDYACEQAFLVEE